MSFNSNGYNLKLIQIDKCFDTTKHECTYIFKFFSPTTKLNYIIRAEYYSLDIFIVKFYPQSLAKSDHRYSIIVNRGDMQNIIATCCKTVPYLLASYPTACFGFMGGRSIDRRNKKKRAENLSNNQRFRIYSRLASLIFGNKTFTHIEYPTISSYMLYNNCHPDMEEKQEMVKEMLIDIYPDLLNY